jgi:hypothetical protein
MKKFIYIISLMSITLSTLYAATTQLPYRSEVVLQSKIETIPYQFTVNYENEEINPAQSFIINGLSITQDGETGLFTIYLSDGNGNKTVTFKAIITPNRFINTDAPESESDTDVVPYIINGLTEDEQNVYEAVRAPGFKDGKEIGVFRIRWTGDPDLQTGFYTSVNTLDISVE